MHTFAQKPKAPQQATPAKSTTHGRAHFRQSHEVHSILHLQRTIGNQAVLRLLQANTEELNPDSATTASTRFPPAFKRLPIHSSAPGGIQPKLTVNTPGDIYEQEADQIADQVMATPAHHAVSGTPPRIQRFLGQSHGQADAVPASVDQALVSPGRPLEPALRQDMEQRFGHDFSRVRVHSDAAAEQSARDVNAHAYTVGQNMVFGAGKFAPRTNEGKRLIAHELAHVVQQTRLNAGIQRKSNECQILSDDKILGRRDIIARIEEAIEGASNNPPFTKAMYEEYLRQKGNELQLCEEANCNEDMSNPECSECLRAVTNEWDDRIKHHNSRYRECAFYVDAGFSPSEIVKADLPWSVSLEFPPDAVATFHTHPPAPDPNISKEDLAVVKGDPNMKHFVIRNREVILIGLGGDRYNPKPIVVDRWPLSQLKKCLE